MVDTVGEVVALPTEVGVKGVKFRCAVRAVTAVMKPRMTNVKWTSNGGPIRLVNDHANMVAPMGGPNALKSDESVMPRPLTRPRSSLAQEALIVRKIEVKGMVQRPWTRQLCATIAAHSSGGESPQRA